MDGTFFGECFLPCIFVIVVAPLVFGFSVRRGRGQREAVRRVAAELGLTVIDSAEALFDPKAATSPDRTLANVPPEHQARARALVGFVAALAPTWKLEGNYRDLRVAIRPTSHGSGKSSSPYTELQVFFVEPLGAGLELAKEGLFDKLAKAVAGTEDVETGDPDFDSKVVVRGTDVAVIRSRLASHRTRDAVLALFAELATARIDDRSIVYELPGRPSDPQLYRDALDLMTTAAKELDAAASARGAGSGA